MWFFVSHPKSLRLYWHACVVFVGHCQMENATSCDLNQSLASQFSYGMCKFRQLGRVQGQSGGDGYGLGREVDVYMVWGGSGDGGEGIRWMAREVKNGDKLHTLEALKTSTRDLGGRR